MTTPDPKPKETPAAKSARIFESALTKDSFENFASRLGVRNDNALSAGTYTFDLITKNRILLEAAYRGSWIVGRIVDAFPRDMTRAGIDISTSEGSEDIPKIFNAVSRLQIWQSLRSLEQWARLYGGAIAVIQIKGQKLDTPLDLETVAQDQFQGLVVYDRWQLNPVLIDVIDSGPDMGLPKYYDIVTSASQSFPTAQTATGQQRVHHSRVIRSIGIQLPFFQAVTEMMWGESVCERLWDRLIAFDNATMSAASLIDRANLRTVQIEGFREIVSGGGPAYDGLVASFEFMNTLQVNNGLTVLDKNDMFSSTAYSFAGLSDMLIQFSQQLSGSSDTPMVVLFGQSPAGLNSSGESDLRMYYDNVNAQQEAKYRNPWEVLLKVLWRSTLGKPAPDDLTFTFNSLWQMTAKDKADIAKINAETITGAFDSGLTDRSTALKELKAISGDTGLFSNITEEDITEAENEDPPDANETDPLPGEEKKPPPAEPPKEKDEKT